MKSVSALRASLILWLIIFTLQVVGPTWMLGQLPDILRDYLATRPAPQLSGSTFVLMGVGATFLIGAPIFAFALLFLKRWARVGLTIVYLLNIAGVAFLEPSIRSGLDRAIGELGVLLLGFALGVAWFSTALQGREHGA